MGSGRRQGSPQAPFRPGPRGCRWKPVADETQMWWPKFHESVLSGRWSRYGKGWALTAGELGPKPEGASAWKSWHLAWKSNSRHMWQCACRFIRMPRKKSQRLPGPGQMHPDSAEPRVTGRRALSFHPSVLSVLLWQEWPCPRPSAAHRWVSLVQAFLLCHGSIPFVFLFQIMFLNRTHF